MTSIHLLSPNIPQIWAAGILWIPASIATVVLRFSARRRAKVPIMLDDWLAAIAATALIGMCAAFLYGVTTKSFGYPTPAPPPNTNPLEFQNAHISILKEIVWSISLLQCLGLACTKISLLLFYRRVFNVGRNSFFDIATRTIILIIVCWAAVFFLAILFWCGFKFPSWWTDVEKINEDCPNALNIEIAYTISDFAIDFLVITVPIPRVLRLKMSTGRKIAVLGVFGMGLLCCAASGMRLVMYLGAVLGLKKAYHVTGANNTPVTVAQYWNILEMGITLIGVCLPIIYGLLVTIISSRYRRNHEKLASEKSSGSKRHSWFRHRWTDSDTETASDESEELSPPIPGVCTAITHVSNAEPVNFKEDQRGIIVITKSYNVAEVAV